MANRVMASHPLVRAGSGMSLKHKHKRRLKVTTLMIFSRAEKGRSRGDFKPIRGFPHESGREQARPGAAMLHKSYKF
jgi:hypothetical protein